MAENPNSEQKRGADKVPQPRDRSASTYSRERLMGESVDFFGEPSHVVAGALAGLDARKQNFTLDEASDAIRAFHQRPVTSE